MATPEEEAKAKADAEAKAKADAEAKAAAERAASGSGENQTGEGDDGEDFDKDRALATIQAQRASEKKLAKDLKDAQAKLKALEEAEQKRQDAEKSELQKAQEKADGLEKALLEAQENAQALKLRHEFGQIAKKLNLNFANAQAEDDAFELADLESVEIDAQGKITGLEEAVKELQKSRPYLFNQGKEGDGQGTPPRNKNGQGKLNNEAVKGFKVHF